MSQPRPWPRRPSAHEPRQSPALGPPRPGLVPHWQSDPAALADASVPKGEDLRIVVLHGSSPSPDRLLADFRRQRVEIDGSPVVIFLHNPDTLRSALKAERHAPARPLVSLLAHATVVGPRPTAFDLLAKRARKIGMTEERPLPAPPKALLQRRAQDLATPADTDGCAASLGSPPRRLAWPRPPAPRRPRRRRKGAGPPPAPGSTRGRGAHRRRLALGLDGRRQGSAQDRRRRDLGDSTTPHLRRQNAFPEAPTA
jgi:hypothetical protein